MLRKKAQAAMEFLMTNGWAMLVVIIVFAAFVFIGLTNPAVYMPDRVILPTGFTVVDHASHNDGIELIIQNNNPKPLSDVKISIENCGEAIKGRKYVDVLPTGKPDTYSILCDITSGSNFQSDIIIEYKMGNLYFTKKGQIMTAVPKTAGAAEYICKNADDAGICDGLDDALWSGFRESCQTNFDLCYMLE